MSKGITTRSQIDTHYPWSIQDNDLKPLHLCVQLFLLSIFTLKMFNFILFVLYIIILSRNLLCILT